MNNSDACVSGCYALFVRETVRAVALDSLLYGSLRFVTWRLISTHIYHRALELVSQSYFCLQLFISTAVFACFVPSGSLPSFAIIASSAICLPHNSS